VTLAKEAATEAPERESSPRCPANMTETTCRLYCSRLHATSGAASPTCRRTSAPTAARGAERGTRRGEDAAALTSAAPPALAPPFRDGLAGSEVGTDGFELSCLGLRPETVVMS